MSLVNVNAIINKSNSYVNNPYYELFMSAYNMNNSYPNYYIYNNNYNPVVYRQKNTYNNTYNSYSTSSIAERAVLIAEEELNKGVCETSKNDSIEIRKYKKGAANKNPWCASFVSYLFGDGQNRSNKDTFGYTASSQSIKHQAKQDNCFAGKNSGYIPQRGDIAIWTNVSDPAHGHVGIVTKADKLGFWVIEGNAGKGNNKVTKNYYSYASLGKRFSGWAQMSKWLDKSKRFETLG